MVSKSCTSWSAFHHPRCCKIEFPSTGLVQALSRATRSQGDGYQFDSGNHDVSSCITGTVSRDWTSELDDTAMGGLNEHQQLYKFLYVSIGKSW
jgi:hypothetical protein